MPFVYHNDPEKTAAAQHPGHANWASLGDVGYLDEDGFLFLTDGRSFMIISGGVKAQRSVRFVRAAPHRDRKLVKGELKKRYA